jgi:hypothetical protein
MEQPMARISKEKLKANRFRSLAAEGLKDSGWLDEGVQDWLKKELQRDPDYIYTENEHAALARIIAAGTLFDGWDGYNVVELCAAAGCYKADGNDEDETFLDDLNTRNATQLRLGEMGHLVGFCRNVAGLPLSAFTPEIQAYEDL